MKLTIYLTLCVLTNAMSDQVEARVSEMQQNNHEMEKRFNEMEQNYEDIATRMDRVNQIEQNHNEMERKYKYLAASVLELTHRVHTMEQKTDELQTENSDLRNTIQELGGLCSIFLVLSIRHLSMII